MSKSITQIRHFALTPEHEASADEIAADVVEAGKGGHIVALHLPDANEPVIVHPHETVDEAAAKVAAVMAPADDTATPPKSRKNQKAAPDEV